MAHREDTQELNYLPIMRTLAETGYVGHEFAPTGEPLQALEAAYRLFDV